MAKVNGVRWYAHVFRRDDGHVLKKALEFEVKGKRKQGRPKKMWKMQVEKENKSVGLEKEDALNRARWRVRVGEIAVRLGLIRSPPFMGVNPDQNWIDDWIDKISYSSKQGTFTVLVSLVTDKPNIKHV